MIAAPIVNRARVGGTRTAGLVHRPPARDPFPDEKGRIVKWFRMYASIVDSVKVGPLSDAAFRVYVELLCLAGEKREAGLTGATHANVCWRLRRNVTEAVTEVVTAGLVDVTDGGEYRVLDWDRRQGEALTGAERTAAWRERKSLEDKDSDDDGDGVTSRVTKRDALEERRGDKRRVTTTSTKNVEVVGAPRKARRRPTVDCPHDQIVELYHAALPDHPKVELLNPARERHLNAWWKRWMEHGSHPYGDPPTVEGGLNFWRRFFEHAGKQPNLTGRMPPRAPYTTPFVADFDYLIGPESHMRVAEAKAPE